MSLLSTRAVASRTPSLRRMLAAAAGALAFGGCADPPTRSVHTAPEVPAGFAISTAERGELRAALLFSGSAQSIRALERRELAERVASAFEELAARIEADDRIGAERAVASARRAVSRYREAVGESSGAAVQLEAMSLALEHAERLARITEPAFAEEAASKNSTDNARRSRMERQP